MSKFRLSHLLIRDHCTLETNLSTKEVLSRVYLKIGKPRPYALERALKSRGPHVFDGAVSRTVDSGYDVVTSRYKDVPIQGTVTSNGGKTRIAIRLGGDNWATGTLIFGAGLVLLLSYLLYDSAMDGKEVNVQMVGILITAVLGYFLGLGIFRSKVGWAKERLAALFEAQEVD